MTCLFYLKVHGQAPYYYTLNEENSLPSSEVYQVIQDDFGYIWIGCDAGLFRYDGFHFKQYNYSRENGKSISELKLDAHGNIWCQNFNGQLFKVKNDSLILFKDFSGQFRIYPQYTVDSEDRVWVVGNNAIVVYNKEGGVVDRIYNLNAKGDTVAWLDVEFDGKGAVYATSQISGLFGLKWTGKKFQHQPISSNLKSGDKVYLERNKNRIFILNETGNLREYQLSEITESGKFKLLSNIRLNQFVYKVGIDSDNQLWLTTSNGIVPVNHQTEVSSYSGQIMQGDKISSFLEDREGNVWLTSLQNGIHIIPNKNLLITNRQNSSISDNFISALTLDKDNSLLFGTYSGHLYRLGKKGEPTSIQTNKLSEYRLARKILPYGNGYLVSRGSFGYVTQSKEIILWPSNIRDFDVMDDTLYFVASNSVSRLDGIKKAIENPLSMPSSLILGKSGRSVAIDKLHRIVYFATINGILVYSNGNYQSLNFNNERINAAKLTFENGKLWIGSLNNGLLSYDGKEVKQEKKVSALMKGTTIKTFKIHNQDIFIATEKCLNRIALNGSSSGYYDVSDGLVSKEVNAIEIMDSTVCLATNKGLVQFPLKMNAINLALPKIQIEKVTLNNQLLDKEKHFTMAFNSGKLKIKFNTSCIRARANFFYSYRLLGADSSATIVNGANNEVIYTSLPPGTYTFAVNAVNEDGQLSANDSKIIFTVNKPFWQKLWFYMLVGLSGALLVLFISLIIIRNIKNKATVRNELINSQLTAIRAQMNPHFMYNTLNSIQDLILKSDIKNTNHYLGRFSNLMRKVLEFSSLEKVAVADEIEMLENYLELEKLRFGGEFTYNIISPQSSGQAQQIPSLVIQPFVENAVKHGLLHKKGHKNLSIRFITHSNSVEVFITDNGIGRKRSDEIKQRSNFSHKSFATGAVQKRLDLLNSGKTKKITYQVTDLFENEEACGTQIHLHFPM
ncbi:MAG: histidine kinase [Bacteroidia bacterium]|nr:histidine kinase [Bacteroidia bacterium]